jgi:hypothetical protein
MAVQSRLREMGGLVSRSLVFGACLACAGLLAACGTEAGGVEGIDGKSDKTEGMFELDATEPSLEARIPIKNLGCPTGGLLTLTLNTDKAKVKVENLRYYAGYISGFNQANPRKVHDVWGAVLGQSIDATLQEPGWFSSWFANERETSASVMLVQQDPPEIDGWERCDHITYGPHELEGEPYLSMQLTLVEGDAAEVGYRVDWFNCAAGLDHADERQQEVCDLAWNALYGRVVGQPYKQYSCPPDDIWCGAWNAIFGGREGTYTEEDVEGAIDDMCTEPEMTLECCD